MTTTLYFVYTKFLQDVSYLICFNIPCLGCVNCLSVQGFLLHGNLFDVVDWNGQVVVLCHTGHPSAVIGTSLTSCNSLHNLLLYCIPCRYNGIWEHFSAGGLIFGVYGSHHLPIIDIRTQINDNVVALSLLTIKAKNRQKDYIGYIGQLPLHCNNTL